MYFKYILVIFALIGAIYCDWELIGKCKSNSTTPFHDWVVANNGDCADLGYGRFSKFQCVDSNTAYGWNCWDAECTKCDPKYKYELRTCDNPNDFYYDCSVDMPDWAALLQTPDYLLISATMDNCKSNHTVTASPLKRCLPNMYNYPSAIYSCNATDVFVTAYEEDNCQGQDHYQYVTPITSCSSDPNVFQYYECFSKQARK